MRVLVGLLFLTALFGVAGAAPATTAEPCLDLDTCMARCARGTATACVRAGELTLDRAGQAPTAQLDAALGKLCDARNARACVVGGELHCSGTQCSSAAAARFRAGCALGDGAACVFSGMLLARGTGGEPKDPARAQQLLDRGWAILDDECTDGSTHACMELGVYRASDRFGAPDKAASADGLRRGVPLLARDCRAGDARACLGASLAYTHGLGARINYLRADAAELAMCKLAPKATSCTLDPAAAAEVAPQLSVGTVTTTTGALEKAPPFRRAIHRRFPAIAHCYQRELMRQPTLAGTVTLKLTIETSGKVSALTATGLPPVDACVGELVKAIEFPPLARRSEVTYPINFQPSAKR